MNSTNCPSKKIVKAVGEMLSRFGLSDNVTNRLRELYTSAGQYYATGLLAVAFGQFTLLALLAGKGNYLPRHWVGWMAVGLLIILYFFPIVAAGGYFLFRAAIFAQLEERVLRLSKLGEADANMRRQLGNPNRWLERRRDGLIGHPFRLSVFYLIFSTLALLGALFLPPK